MRYFQVLAYICLMLLDYDSVSLAYRFTEETTFNHKWLSDFDELQLDQNVIFYAYDSNHIHK